MLCVMCIDLPIKLELKLETRYFMSRQVRPGAKSCMFTLWALLNAISLKETVHLRKIRIFLNSFK